MCGISWPSLVSLSVYGLLGFPQPVMAISLLWEPLPDDLFCPDGSRLRLIMSLNNSRRCHFQKKKLATVYTRSRKPKNDKHLSISLNTQYALNENQSRKYSTFNTTTNNSMYVYLNISIPLINSMYFPYIPQSSNTITVIVIIPSHAHVTKRNIIMTLQLSFFKNPLSIINVSILCNLVIGTSSNHY